MRLGFETHALNDPMDEGDFQTFQQALQVWRLFYCSAFFAESNP